MSTQRALCVGFVVAFAALSTGQCRADFVSDVNQQNADTRIRWLIVNGLPLPSIEVAVSEGPDWRCGLVVLGSCVAFAGDYFLGATPIGAFSASAEFALKGPAITFYWYPFEDVAHFVRLELFQRRVVCGKVVVP